MFNRLMLVGLLGILIQDTLLVTKVAERGIKVKRDLSPALEEANQAIRGLNYIRDISTAAQDGDWYATTKGEMLEYTTPSKEIAVRWKEAVQLCIEKRAKIWDKNPQQGLGFDQLKHGEEYWIASDDGAMAKYTTTDIPELVYDKICTTVKVENPVEDEEPQIVVKTVVENDADWGCTDDNTLLGYA